MALLDRLVDRRAFAGAVALLIVGIQMTSLLVLYFIANSQVRAMFQARWFWELALNFQIFLLFLMFVCHVDRISGATGWRRVRATSRMLTGFVGVAMPFITLVVGARNNWFLDKPPFEDIRSFAFWLIGLWVITAYAVPLGMSFAGERRHFLYLTFEGGKGWPLVLFWTPLVIVSGVIVGTMVRPEDDVLWTAVPVALYLHGAMPYLHRAFIARPQEARVQEGAAHAREER